MIKKTSETRALAGNIVNAYNDSQTSAYSTEYINDLVTYPENEQVIGYWIDGKPVYKRVITLQNDLTINANSWSSNIESMSNVKMFVNALGLYPGGATSLIRATVANGYFTVMNPFSFQIIIKYIVIEYTKTTD